MKYKQVTLLCALAFSTVATHAQQAEKFNPEKEKREINGYTIRLMPMPANTFGFSIMKGNKPIYSQLSDPFTRRPIGFKSKDEAYKLAEWVTGEDSKKGRPPVTIPMSVAKQLNLQSVNTQQ